MNLLWDYLTNPANWAGPTGVWARIGEHLGYTLVTLLLAALIAVPLGLWIGHTGRGRVVVVNLVNGFRSMPTLGLLFLAVLLLGPRLRGDLAFVAPSVFVLVVLAVPPILAGAYAGVTAVDPQARDAARGMGMNSWQILRQVELPCALPLLFGGLRSAALQVVATATVAAAVSVGGLGRLLIDGQAMRDYGQMAAGAVVVALLALVVDGVFALTQRLLISPGLRSGAAQRDRRSRTRSTRAAAPAV
ncbi:MAG TPA: ABC transporter permease subunit [Marmoricola sp.]|nr:ABC transporter permease subunit [Marmoricola sp.]